METTRTSLRIKREQRGSVWGLVVALALAWGSSSAAAQWRIGQTAGFSGPAAASVKEVTDGARLYFDAVNKTGGVSGQPIELVSLDDRFEPPQAAENAQKLINQGGLALFLTRGTPHNQAILPLLASARLPLVAPSTGALVLHQPVNPWVFNVRASYQREAERVVRHLSLLGVERIAVLQVDDSFGNDATTGARKGLRRAGKVPTRESLRDALEGMKKVDIGGLEINFSPTDHTGLDYADLSIVGEDGRFRR